LDLSGSIFTDGVFLKTQMDTLRFTFQKQSLTDGLVWWQSNIEVGLPQWLYASDSSFFGLADRMFTTGIKDVKKIWIICRRFHSLSNEL
jgi:hypothetical protein